MAGDVVTVSSGRVTLDLTATFLPPTQPGIPTNVNDFRQRGPYE